MPSPLLPRNEQDPTGQDKRERGAINEFAKKVRAVGLGIKAILKRQPYQVLTLNAADVEMRKYLFNIDESVMDGISAEISALIDAILLEGGKRDLWLLKAYVVPAYQQATGQAVANLSIQSQAYAAARPSLESVLLSQPYQNRLGYVRARVFEDMQGLTAYAKDNLGRALMQGMADGKNPLDIAKDITARTGVVDSRARMIARTEVNTAFRRARMDEDDDAAASLGIRTMQLHISALSPTTRPKHASRNGLLYSTEQQREWWSRDGNSVNCKCSTIAVLVDEKGNPLTPGIVDRVRSKKASALAS